MRMFSLPENKSDTGHGDTGSFFFGRCRNDGSIEFAGCHGIVRAGRYFL
jgi:hypothetical protein